jgi:hypothetical protein
MELKKIFTMANKAVYYRFIAMERSLRLTGCTLPLYVLPYDNDRFNLPDNAFWVEEPNLYNWLDSFKLRGVYRKYYCLLQQDYMFVDSDVIFLTNPVHALSRVNGFITSCGHWHNPLHTTTAHSEAILRGFTTNWPARVFNTGQFACSEVLFTQTDLIKLSENYAETCLNAQIHEQPGINLLVNLAGATVINLTLPPYNMESTWAGDYLMTDYEKYWVDEAKKPFIIHWAGRGTSVNYPIDKLYLDLLTIEETTLMQEAIKQNLTSKHRMKKLIRQSFKFFFK